MLESTPGQAENTIYLKKTFHLKDQQVYLLLAVYEVIDSIIYV